MILRSLIPLTTQRGQEMIIHQEEFPFCINKLIFIFNKNTESKWRWQQEKNESFNLL